jgi:hypothetical protein
MTDGKQCLNAGFNDPRLLSGPGGSGVRDGGGALYARPQGEIV